jgi:hypothetical protein
MDLRLLEEQERESGGRVRTTHQAIGVRLCFAWGGEGVKGAHGCACLEGEVRGLGHQGIGALGPQDLRRSQGHGTGSLGFGVVGPVLA